MRLPCRIVITIYILIIFCAPVVIFCQKNAGGKTPSIFVKARAQKDRILLRWTVDQPNAWAMANKYGLIVERYTVLRNGHAYAGSEKVVLAQNGIQQHIKGDFGKDTVVYNLLTPSPETLKLLIL